MAHFYHNREWYRKRVYIEPPKADDHALEGRYRQLPGNLPGNWIYRGSGLIYPITR
jgi:hypothetical protein